MGFFDTISASAPLVWWRLNEVNSSGTVSNIGTGASYLTLSFPTTTSSNFTILSGAANASNQAWVPSTNVSAAFYINNKGQGYGMRTDRVHDLDFINTWDTALSGTSSYPFTSVGWTIECFYKQHSTVDQTRKQVVWSWGGFDTNLERIELLFDANNNNLAAINPRIHWNYFSSSTSNDCYFDFANTAWVWGSINDMQWHHIAVTFVQQALIQPTLVLMFDGKIQTFTATPGTWPTFFTGSYFRNYAGGTRFVVGANSGSYNASNAQTSLISDVIIYNRPVAGSELYDHFMAATQMSLTGGLIYSPTPSTTVPQALRINIASATGTTGGADARASKVNPGTN